MNGRRVLHGDPWLTSTHFLSYNRKHRNHLSSVVGPKKFERGLLTARFSPKNCLLGDVEFSLWRLILQSPL